MFSLILNGVQIQLKLGLKVSFLYKTKEVGVIFCFVIQKIFSLYNDDFIL